MRARTLSILCAGTFAAVSAHASQPPITNVEPDSIVVTGQRLTLEQLHDRATAFVRGVGVANGETSVARWVQPVCLRVVGIAPHQAEAVEARMLAIAAAAGVGTTRGRCEPNIIVSFTADAAAVVREIDRRQPRQLSEVPRDSRAALLDGDAPVRWWYTTETRSRHGMGSTSQSAATEGSGAQGLGKSTSIGIQGIQHYNSSIVSTQTMRTLFSASVVIDADRLEGRSLDSIASYAAFVAFAEVREADFAPPGSILSLFDSPAAPRELADQDLAFLRALYSLPLDREARLQRGQLVGAMVEQVAASTGVEN